MTRILTALILTLFIIPSQAQNKHHIEIETDPLAWSLGGASGHLAYTWKNERVQLGYGALELPESFQDNEEVAESFQAISFKWEYYFGKTDPSHGFFAGPSLDYLFTEYEDEAGNTLKENNFSAGFRFGYRFDLFANHTTLNGLYLTPWAGLNYLTKNKDYTLGDQRYSRQALKFFPTVHLGWSF